MEFLNRYDKFYQMLIEQAKQDNINEQEFFMLMVTKAKVMAREEREFRHDKKGYVK